ncbi:MAG: cbb3-type cytochrome c oxidase subunit 3 [Oceanospirillaceae bacterium]|nr:cbb3-type cytochrome c oxidase subunit 3 [Oceanospirillaceae bacterium]
MSYETYGPYIPVIMLLTFIGLFVWVLNPRNKKRFDDAAELPFKDEEMDQRTRKADQESNGGVER